MTSSRVMTDSSPAEWLLSGHPDSTRLSLPSLMLHQRWQQQVVSEAAAAEVVAEEAAAEEEEAANRQMPAQAEDPGSGVPSTQTCRKGSGQGARCTTGGGGGRTFVQNPSPVLGRMC